MHTGDSYTVGFRRWLFLPVGSVAVRSRIQNLSPPCSALIFIPLLRRYVIRAPCPFIFARAASCIASARFFRARFTPPVIVPPVLDAKVIATSPSGGDACPVWPDPFAAHFAARVAPAPMFSSGARGVHAANRGSDASSMG